MIPNNLPHLELLSALNSCNNLSHIDPDANIPKQVNFKYFTTQEFKEDVMAKLASRRPRKLNKPKALITNRGTRF